MPADLAQVVGSGAEESVGEPTQGAGHRHLVTDLGYVGVTGP